MTALLEFKQKIKGLYAKYEMYLQPLMKFVLALVYFIWINSNMGYMTALDNMFVVLILALICSILPSGMTIFAGFAMMVGHSYALGIDVAGFMLVLILFMMIVFLRFSTEQNIVVVFTPLACAFDLPVLLPIGCGLLSSALSALPAAGGVILYYFVRFLGSQSQMLQNPDAEILDRITLLSDGLMKNGEMWLTLVAFVAVILVVNLIRTRMIMLIGSIFMEISISVVPMIIFSVVSVLIGLVLEFFVYGGDYTRTERLEYEDDEYYYYVKAVPKALVATSERSIKKINAEPPREDKNRNERVVKYNEPLFHGQEPQKQAENSRFHREEQMLRKPSVDNIDFEKKLEESLKDL